MLSKQVLANPFCRLHPLNFAFALHCRLSRLVCLGPDELPWPVLPCEVSVDLISLIMEDDAGIQILCLPDVESAARILQNIYPEDGSPHWTLFATFFYASTLDMKKTFDLLRKGSLAG